MRKLFLMLLLLLPASAAQAHHPQLSLVDIEVGDADVAFTLTSDVELFDSAAQLDSNANDTVEEDELLEGREALERYLQDRLRVATPRHVCPGTLEELRYDKRRTAAVVTMRYLCPEPLGSVEILNRVFTERVGNHQFVGTILEEGREHRVVFNRRDPLVRYEATPPEATEVVEQTDERIEEQSTFTTFTTYLVLGVEHILIGIDHVLFILSLLIVARRFRDLVILVTTFTLAHSITLGLAALEVVTPSPDIVEPIIAASIAFVAIENILRESGRFSSLEREPRGRPLVVFGFGLVHGFGFAGVLTELGLDSSHLVASLAGFNIGVELGQLAIVAVSWPLLARLGFPRPGYYRFVVAVSMLIALASLWWVIERIWLT